MLDYYIMTKRYGGKSKKNKKGGFLGMTLPDWVRNPFEKKPASNGSPPAAPGSTPGSTAPGSTAPGSTTGSPPGSTTGSPPGSTTSGSAGGGKRRKKTRKTKKTRK